MVLLSRNNGYFLKSNHRQVQQTYIFELLGSLLVDNFQRHCQMQGGGYRSMFYVFTAIHLRAIIKEETVS